MTWNVVAIAPLTWLAVRQPARGDWYFVVAYGLAAIVWFVGKRACLVHARRLAPHENA
jgi:hypothetical protein